jgi:hypothetical protein
MLISNHDNLADARWGLGTPVYRASYSEVKAFYKEQYGEKAWKSRLASDLAPMMGTGKNGQPLKDPRGAALRQLERFEKGQRGVGAKYQGMLSAIGKMLPPKFVAPPENGLRIRFSGWVTISGKQYRRTFDKKMTYSQSVRFLNDPTFTNMVSFYFQGIEGPGDDWIAEIEPA